MTDRQIVYAGQLPQDTDLLGTNLNMLIGQAFLNQALLGSSTVAAGLACTPTGPASLVVNIGVGSIYELDPVDASSYGSLGSNNAVVLKQGILQTALALTITPPGTAGFSQNFLVQAILQDIDIGAQVLSYYNSANPSQPFSGPANSGSSQFTVRSCKCTVALKAGTPATTGSQTTPAPDAGYVGLFAITAANGATQITSGNIAQLSSAPFFPTLPQVPYDVQQQNYCYAGQDTGAANAYVITFAAGQPIPASYKAGMSVVFKALNACTGASTINVQGLGVVAIRRANGVATAANDIVSGQVVKLTYDGTLFQITNYIGAGTTSNTSTIVDIPYVADSGTQNALIATFSPTIGAYTDGIYVGVKLANTITGAATINANGLGVKAIVLGDGSNPPFNVFVAGEILLLVYSTAMGKFQIANTSAGMFYKQPTANYTIYVNTSTGSDTLCDGTAATVGTGTSGPFKTIQKGVTTAFSYAPSQFTITVQVAAGTYLESVQTPNYAGPNLIINGAGLLTTIIGSGNAHSIVVNGPNTVTISNLTVGNSGAGEYHGFLANGGASIITSSTGSNTIGGGAFAAFALGEIVPGGNHTFFSNVGAAFWTFTNGLIAIGAFSFTINSPISANVAFAVAEQGGAIQVGPTPTFPNAAFVSGAKYFASLNGTINASGLGVNFFPGSSGGSTSLGGQYQS